MTRDKWWCERCGVQGWIKIPDGTDVYTAIDLLRDAHDRKSATCATRVLRIQKGRPVKAHQRTEGS